MWSHALPFQCEIVPSAYTGTQGGPLRHTQIPPVTQALVSFGAEMSVGEDGQEGADHVKGSHFSPCQRSRTVD